MYNAISFDRCGRGSDSIGRIRTCIHRYHLFAHQKTGGVGIGIFVRTAVTSGRPVHRHALAVGRGERRIPCGIGAGQFHGEHREQVARFEKTGHGRAGHSERFGY